jgi:glycosyltransferase involved in cell wall biosynthesis
LDKNKTILFIPPVHWNYYPYRDQELPAILAAIGYSCIYLNPLEYKGSENASRFARVNNKIPPENSKMVDRSTTLRKSLVVYIYENYLNYKAVKKYKPLAVITTNHLMSVFTCLYCWFKNVKFVFDVTDSWELVDRSLAGKFYKVVIKPFMAHMAYAITCTSQVQYEYFNARRKEKTYLISNGIATHIYEALKITIPDTEKSKSVNFIGSLRDWYDFDLIFDVFANIPELELNIYGQGYLIEKLRIKSENIPNIKIHGNIDNRLTPGILKNTLFGILPLKQDELNNSTCPIKLFDYWGASKAVISTPVDEIKRIGGDTILYASTREEFIFQIRRLLNDPQLAIKLGNKGFQKIETIHNYKYISHKFIELLNL